MRDKLDKRSCDILYLKLLLMSFSFDNLLSTVVTKTAVEQSEYFALFFQLVIVKSISVIW